MAAWLNVLVKIGPEVLVWGLLLSLFLVLLSLIYQNKNPLRYLVISIARVMAIGFVAWFVGTFIGIMLFCSSEEMGNLCGLGGVFGVGPIFAGCAMFFYALRKLLKLRV